MTRQLHLGLFEAPAVNIMGMALWAHPEHTATRFTDLAHWEGLAQRLHDAAFDFLFLADSYGWGELDGARPDVNAAQALDLPRMDPSLVIAALTRTGPNLGHVLTAPTMFEPPYSFSRRLATLDHLTGGRVGWNVVTSSFAETASRAFGQPMVAHDERYAMAEEHLEVVYALLEGSWEDDAVLADRERRVYADPSKVHEVRVDGRWFRTRGYSNAVPSPQRTPVLFQAGSSRAGLAFATRHAEGVFLQGSTPARLAEHVAGVHAGAARAGRGPGAVKTFVGLSVVVAPSREQAQARHAEYLALNTRESAIASYALFTGVELGRFDPDAPFAGVRTELGQSQVERHTRPGGVPGPTVGDVIEAHRTRGSRGLVVVGDPDDVTGQVLELADSTGVDGFLLEPFVEPGSLDDVVEHVLPRLRAAGRFRHEYEESTLRERLFGPGQRRLRDDHPGAAHRRPAPAPAPVEALP